MRLTFYSSSRLSWLLLLAVSLSHCGKTNFDGSRAASGPPAVKSDIESKDLEASDPEESTAAEPVAVGGAFLNCAYVPTLATETQAAIQCEFNSEGHDPGRAQDLAYKFSTGSNRPAASAIIPSEQEFKTDGERQRWLWTFYFSREQILEGWLFVDIQDRVRDLDAMIKVEVAIPPLAAAAPAPNPAPVMERTATPPSLFRFNSGPQKLGDDGAGVGVEAGCAALDKAGIPMSRSRSYSITLAAETALTIVLSNLCGVGTGQTNTAGSFSTVSLRNASNAEVFRFNLANQTKLTFASSKLPAGAYSLTITPASRANALNDFVYSDLLIEGAGIAVK